ncbi:MAG: hypothetical protein MI919_30335, partial [Holophagales bacterium]|nr:hypothetical protein [Holophagales bacterium]
MSALLALMAAPASADRFGFYDTTPSTARADQAFRLQVAGQLEGEAAVEMMPLSISGSRLVLVLLTEERPASTITPFVHSIGVEPLEQGTYELEVVTRKLGTEELVSLLDGPLHVGAGFSLKGVPEVIVTPAFGLLTFDFEGIGSCPLLSSPVISEREILLEYDDNCPFLPGDPAPFSSEIEIPLPLDPPLVPGAYSVVVKR